MNLDFEDSARCPICQFDVALGRDHQTLGEFRPKADVPQRHELVETPDGGSPKIDIRQSKHPKQRVFGQDRSGLGEPSSKVQSDGNVDIGRSRPLGRSLGHLKRYSGRAARHI
jgi:hypothetical protein